MRTCLHCSHPSLLFDEELSYAKFGLEGEGVVTIYHCENCGAVITVMMPVQESGESDESRDC